MPRAKVYTNSSELIKVYKVQTQNCETTKSFSTYDLKVVTESHQTI